jgi:hypothetical protein
MKKRFFAIEGGTLETVKEKYKAPFPNHEKINTLLDKCVVNIDPFTVCINST